METKFAGCCAPFLMIKVSENINNDVQLILKSHIYRIS